MPRLLLLLLTATMLSSTPVLASSRSDTTEATIRFHVLLRGKVVGSHVSTRRGNELETHFDYSDRGRGPVLDSRIILGPDGIPTELRTTCHYCLPADARRD